MIRDLLKVLNLLRIADVGVYVPTVTFMLPNVTSYGWALLFADKMITLAMFQVKSGNPVKTYFP